MIWIPAKRGDVIPQPLESCSLISYSEILGAEGRCIRKTEEIEAITRFHRNTHVSNGLVITR